MMTIKRHRDAHRRVPIVPLGQGLQVALIVVHIVIALHLRLTRQKGRQRLTRAQRIGQAKQEGAQILGFYMLTHHTASVGETVAHPVGELVDLLEVFAAGVSTRLANSKSLPRGSPAAAVADI